MGDKNESGSSNKYKVIGTGLGLLVGAGAALYTYYNSQQNQENEHSSQSSSNPRNSTSSSPSSPSSSQANRRSTTSADPERQLPPGW